MIMDHSVESFPRMVSGQLTRIQPNSIKIVRESILLDKYNRPIPMRQVMPIYIPKEPTKACVSSPLSKSVMSSRHGSMLLSEVESDTCSVLTQSTMANNRPPSLTDPLSQSRSARQRTKRSKHRAKKNGYSAGSEVTKPRPVNIVGPIVSQSDNVEDREEVFSASGAESVESEGDLQHLHDELVAQKKLINKLEEDLKGQLKVNSELKKLLVASVGDDLEYRVEKLAQDKAQLSATLGSYSEKLYKDVEDLDRISIQADMWRSKYLASQVQSNELSHSKLALTHKYTEAMSALQRMLEERRDVNQNLRSSYNMIADSCLADTSSLNHPLDNHLTTHQLSESLFSLASLILTGSSLPSDTNDRPSLTAPGDGQSQQLTEAEAAAYTVLSEQVIPQSPIEVPFSEDIPRFSSLLCQTRATSRKGRGEVIDV